jgi:3-deoxy-manno-octulosonate cytidylyltransferase (CMP-KDO synthetase)
MLIVGMIPARFGSSRFPGKPLAQILGKPMIQHVYERARRANRLNRLLVATDDERILQAVKAFGGEVLLTGVDHLSGTDRLAEAAGLLGLADDDIIVNIQGDEPALEPVMIELLVEALELSPDVPMSTLAFLSHDGKGYLDPNVVKVVVNQHGQALYFSRAPIPYRREVQDGPSSFLKHLGFYSYRHEFLQTFTKLSAGTLENLERLEQLRAMEHGYSIQVALSPVDTRGVDTPEDLQHLLDLWGK